MNNHDNPYVVRLGHGPGTGGRTYEILGTRESLGRLAANLQRALAEYDTGELSVLRKSRELGIPITKDDEVPVVAELVSHANGQTSDLGLAFVVVPTLAPFHVPRRLRNALSNVGMVLWKFVLPLAGLVWFAQSLARPWG